MVIGDSHIRRIRRDKFNNSIENAKSYVKGFEGAKVEHMKYHIIPMLKEQQPDIVILHIGSNNISFKNLKINPLEIATSIVEIAQQCCSYNVNEIIISSITVKKSIRLTSIIREVNDALESLCLSRKFHFIRNDDITPDHLTDGVHLNEYGTGILASNFVDYINNYVFDNSYWQKICNETFYDTSNQESNFQNSNLDSSLPDRSSSDIKNLFDIKEKYPRNPQIGYLNINSIRNKMISLKLLTEKILLDILCIDETKIDESFPDFQFEMENYQFPPFC